MKLKTSHAMDIAKFAISLSLFNIIIAFSSHHSIIISKVRSNSDDGALKVVKEAVRDIDILKNIEVRQ